MHTPRINSIYGCYTFNIHAPYNYRRYTLMEIVKKAENLAIQLYHHRNLYHSILPILNHPHFKMFNIKMGERRGDRERGEIDKFKMIYNHLH